jgi:hypothetical protein
MPGVAVAAMLKRGMAVILTAAVVMAAATAAQAATKKTKHAKSPPVAHKSAGPNAAQPAPPGPPDPGNYK